MSEQFKDYVTGGAFHLSLSRRQTEMLSQMDQYGCSWGYVGTGGALIAKGLCERTDDNGFPKFQLTDAGRAVIPLLKLAGLYTRNETPPPVELPPIDIQIRRREPV
jgi:hypothetical protein